MLRSAISFPMVPMETFFKMKRNTSVLLCHPLSPHHNLFLVAQRPMHQRSCTPTGAPRHHHTDMEVWGIISVPPGLGLVHEPHTAERVPPWKWKLLTEQQFSACNSGKHLPYCMEKGEKTKQTTPHQQQNTTTHNSSPNNTHDFHINQKQWVIQPHKCTDCLWFYSSRSVPCQQSCCWTRTHPAPCQGENQIILQCKSRGCNVPFLHIMAISQTIFSMACYILLMPLRQLPALGHLQLTLT